jgi:methyl-accepting chemotaxis protein
MPKKPVKRLKSKPRKEGRKAMSANSEEKVPVNGEIREGANVDKIRDILFGSQMRDYDKRFGRLEERLAKAADALREDLKKRFDSLESFVQQEVESLHQRLKTEKSERVDATKELTRETRDSAKSFENRLSQIDEHLTQAQGDLRTRILDQSKTLLNEIQKAHSEMEASLEREAETLRNDKTDRATLADLLTEMALRLKDELELPGK